MAFDPKTLPVKAYEAFKAGPKYWPLIVQSALDFMIFDVTKLTDMVFYCHHPERIGNPLKPHESKLINQWKAFRTTIAPWAEQRRVSHYLVWNGLEGTDVGGVP